MPKKAKGHLSIFSLFLVRCLCSFVYLVFKVAILKICTKNCIFIYKIHVQFFLNPLTRSNRERGNCLRLSAFKVGGAVVGGEWREGASRETN